LLAGSNHQPGDCLVRVQRLFSPAQDGCIAGLETEAGGVSRDIRTRFVNDHDNTNGRCDFLEFQSVGASSVVENFSNRVGQCGDFTQTIGHGCDPFIVEFEAVKHGGRKTHFRRGLHVQGIGRFDCMRLPLERICHGLKARVFLGGCQPGQITRSRPGAFGQFSHLLGQAHGGKVGQKSGLNSNKVGRPVA
jgi:hypothetical protein